ncbi:hypothetical protein COU95_02360 [Candidatus Shapirobacteria bacterium CG10_big_fil_rev_8_21_14_0_10_40_9]|uniref:Uncharacterized protein n=1 Tax=Candidatus Shapirobacteria bacterium CG10_big_fil_rev_8_21_14_0_10_40_9 TaxID=1974888 RepID=A0A2M8L3F3_9BACT|nr:MAG: hypothetical protein COU95_02360 [Candidatus Shapirobacteria bacterium CG10_big_fil_rev_8_21_14_0_10_40_9]
MWLNWTLLGAMLILYIVMVIQTRTLGAALVGGLAIFVVWLILRAIRRPQWFSNVLLGAMAILLCLIIIQRWF